MKKKFIATILTTTLMIGMLSGCGNSSQETVETVAQSEETTDTASEEEADTSYYDEGLAYLYGLDGKEIDLEEAYTNFEKAVEEGETEANFYLGVLYYDWYGYPETDYAKAKSYFEAAGDNSNAQIMLGLMYYYGNGVEEDKVKGQELIDTAIEQGYMEGYAGSGYIARGEKNYDTAMECYNKALESDEQLFIALAMNQIGLLYYNGEGIEQDYAVALEWFEKAADLGKSSAMYNVGNVYYYGRGVEQDYAKALEWFEKAADLGYSDAMNDISYIYKNGQGVEQDYAKAMEWYEKSADLGNSSAMNQIGLLYENGQGVEQDYAKAMEWYEKAADLGYSTAMSNIGNLYKNGRGVEQDYAKAMEWYEKAADLGYSVAMNNIGYMYYNGQGVEQDYGKTLEWFEKSADLGNSEAMNNIGYFYQRGYGVVEQDYGKALEWFEKSADLGNSEAMNNIGYFYMNGYGVERDYAKALEWYEKSADLGYSTALDNINYMKENGLGVEKSATETGDASESIVTPETNATAASASGSIKERGDRAIAEKGYIDVGVDMTFEEWIEYMGYDSFDIENDGRGKDMSGIDDSSVVWEENAG